jgi:methylated-DNA-[protein]-cysteine S-methyltransferase
MGPNELKRAVTRAEADRRSRALVSALGEAAAGEGLVDVALGTLESPVGELLVAVTPRGVVYVAFESEDRDELLATFARRLSPRVLTSAKRTDEARRELTEYFGGDRRRFDLALDRRLMSPFARQVLAATAKVDFGHVSTYGQIAKRIGRPTASRAVGAALGSNPIPIVLPCHRIVGVGGRLTGYAGGVDRKERLLEFEGSLPPSLPTS